MGYDGDVRRRAGGHPYLEKRKSEFCVSLSTNTAVSAAGITHPKLRRKIIPGVIAGDFAELLHFNVVAI